MAQKTGSFQFGSYGFFIRSRDIQNFPKEPADAADSADSEQRIFIKLDGVSSYLELSKPETFTGKLKISYATSVLATEMDFADGFGITAGGIFKAPSSVTDIELNGVSIGLNSEALLDGRFNTVEFIGAVSETITVYGQSGLGTNFFNGFLANPSTNDSSFLLDQETEDLEYNKENTFGAEDAVNGSFTTDSDWSKGTGVTISGGMANSDGTIAAFATVLGQIALTVGKFYAYSYKLPSINSGSLQIKLGSNGQPLQSVADTYTGLAKAESDGVLRFSSGGLSYNGTVDDVSIKEMNGNAVRYIGTIVRELFTLTEGNWLSQQKSVNGDFDDGDTGWNKGTGVTISGGMANSDGTIAAFATALSQVILDIGDRYLYVYKLLNFNSGSTQIKLGSNGQSVDSGNGIFTGIDNAEGDSVLRLSSVSVPLSSDIDDFSVKKILEIPWQGSQIAHRGFLDEAPENTMSAYANAVSLSVRHLECDVQITSDGEYVLLHDSTIDRTSSGTGAIVSLTYSQADAFDYGSWFNVAFAGERIPKFNDFCVFADTNNCVIYPEIKSTMSNDEISGMIDIIVANNLEASCIIQAFNHADLNVVRDINPNITLGYLSVSLIDTSTMLNNSYALIQASTLISDIDYIKSTQNKGFKVAAWSASNQSTYDILADEGIDGMMTDTKLRQS